MGFSKVSIYKLPLPAITLNTLFVPIVEALLTIDVLEPISLPTTISPVVTRDVPALVNCTVFEDVLFTLITSSSVNVESREALSARSVSNTVTLAALSARFVTVSPPAAVV